MMNCGASLQEINSNSLLLLPSNIPHFIPGVGLSNYHSNEPLPVKRNAMIISLEYDLDPGKDYFEPLKQKHQVSCYFNSFLVSSLFKNKNVRHCIIAK